MIMLEQNYRSTQRILQAANDVITNNKSRYDKKLRTDNDEGDSIYVYKASDEKDESQFVVGKIIELKEQENLKLDQFAVLYRTNAQSRVIEEYLVKSNLDYTIVGGTKFYERKEIKDLLAYLKLISNNDDDLALPELSMNRSEVSVLLHSIKWRVLQLNMTVLFSTHLQEVDFMGITSRAANEVA